MPLTVELQTEQVGIYLVGRVGRNRLQRIVQGILTVLLNTLFPVMLKVSRHLRVRLYLFGRKAHLDMVFILLSIEDDAHTAVAESGFAQGTYSNGGTPLLDHHRIASVGRHQVVGQLVAHGSSIYRHAITK